MLPNTLQCTGYHSTEKDQPQMSTVPKWRRSALMYCQTDSNTHTLRPCSLLTLVSLTHTGGQRAQCLTQSCSPGPRC